MSYFLQPNSADIIRWVSSCCMHSLAVLLPDLANFQELSFWHCSKQSILLYGIVVLLQPPAVALSLDCLVFPAGGRRVSFGSESMQERNRAERRSSTIRGSLDGPSVPTTAQYVCNQLSQHTSKASENMSAILAAGRGAKSPPRDPRSPTQQPGSQKGPKSLPAWFSTTSQSPTARGGGHEPGSASPRSPPSGPQSNSWGAANMFGFWAGASSQPSSPNTDRTDSPDLTQQRGVQSSMHAPDSSGSPHRQRSYPTCAPESLPVRLGSKPQFLTPDFTSGPSGTSGQGSSLYRDGSDHRSHEESPVATTSGDLVVESTPHFGEVHVQPVASGNSPPREQPKAEYALLQGLQALGSVVGSAIDSFSMVRSSQPCTLALGCADTLLLSLGRHLSDVLFLSLVYI